MKKTLFSIIAILFVLPNAAIYAQSAKVILDKIDKNLSSTNRVMESDMIIYGKRRTRTISSRTYAVGNKKSFTEYLAPSREKGTKMLKLGNELWIYSPATDRIIKISGHMLRQSVMGSDLSYEDMMDNRKLTDVYNAKIIGKEEIDGRKTYILELDAKVEDVSYHKIKLWVDTERYVPLKEELYAKSGKLLKKMTFSDIKRINGRWYPMKFNYKDVLKNGKGTDFIIKKIDFDVDIPDYIFTKAALRR
ncbi:MAG TPA: outer membrane lipoprotein-sorting protein [Bacteroidetes bacterium]|nr:outer membrane lipoprotein-sorting protein [Bacteroidota bacterium]